MITQIFEEFDNYYVRVNDDMVSLLNHEKTLQIDITERNIASANSSGGAKRIRIEHITMNASKTQMIDYQQRFSEKTIKVLKVDGTNIIKEEEAPLLIKFIKTAYAMMIVTGDINSRLFVSITKMEEIIRKHFELNQQLLTVWLNEGDLISQKKYTRTIENKELTVTKEKEQVKLNFKNIDTDYEEEYVIQQDGIHFLSTKSKENELLVFDTAYMIKETLRALFKKLEKEVANPKEIISMNEIRNIEPKDVYVFKRTWANGFYEDQLIEKVVKITENRIKIKEMNVYEMPKYEKKEINKEELKMIKKFAERIQKATEYKFDDHSINQKIYEYEKLMIEVRVNIEKLQETTKQRFEKTFKDEEYEFLLLARNFNQEEVKDYLDRYITKSILDMNNMMEDVREKYAKEMEFMLQLIEKRRTM